MKFDISIFFKNLSRKFKFHQSLTRITGILHKNKYIYIFCCSAATQRRSWPPRSWGILHYIQRRISVGRNSSGRVISSSQRPLPDNTQHSQQTNIRAPGGIRTHDLSRRAAANLRFRPRGHWDRPIYIHIYIIFRSVLPRMRYVSDKSCRENQNTHFKFHNFFR
jgi:hypothetical protein